MDRSETEFGAEPVFGQIETVSLTQRVISALKEAFFTGKLKPGDPIIERQLAREMNVGTPVVREALISLKHEGFVRRVNNKGSYVTQFEAEEVRQLYALRVELETLALQWARVRVTAADLDDLTDLVDHLVEAGDRGNRAEFLRRDFEFHRAYWKLSGNLFLADQLERLMAPLFAFVVLASEMPTTAAMGREHYVLVDALARLQDPEFTDVVRKALTGFALRWVAATASTL
jgi:DNA-binding GntR family transcriptional regulator